MLLLGKTSATKTEGPIKIPLCQLSMNIVDQAPPSPTNMMYISNINPTVLTYEDDGQNYGCVITMGDFSANATQMLTVYRKYFHIFLDLSTRVG